MSLELDPRFTFDAFVVGPANRLAVAAAKRVAESPGTSYNPLLIYSASGLGKTHLLSAIGHEAGRLHAADTLYDTVERLMDRVSRAVEAGERDAFRSLTRDHGLILLDDVQFLAGRRQIQEELIRAWDELTGRGGQVVLTSDRPPQDIDGLDDRLVSRLSGGLIVDMGAPDYETRVAIARRKADERGGRLDAEVFKVLARVAFTNVRELQGALNRLLAVQELEGRPVTAPEVARLLGSAADRGIDEFGEFLSDISGTVTNVVEAAERKVADAILAWEGEGYRTRRLDSALMGALTAAQADGVIRRFEQDVARLCQIEAEVRALDADAPELGAAALRDPDRVAEAEVLLATVRDRQAPPPAPPPGPGLDAEQKDSLALRACRAVAASPASAYNPLFVKGPPGAGKSRLVVALANDLMERHGLVVAYADGAGFEAELIEALSHGRLEGWRARYRRADALVLDGVDALGEGEAAHDELFHLFEDLHRRGRQIVFAARAAPADLPLPPRLQSRLESGLVVELDGEAEAIPASPPPARPAAPTTGLRAGHWILSGEKVLWEWPYPDEAVEEALD
jgi:chromosomal replication initiator protein